MNASERPGEGVTMGAASVAAVEDRSQPVVHSDPEIMGGEPVFVGTRVPLNA